MIHKVISIGRWVVDFLIADKGYDIEGVLACLYDISIPKRMRDRAYEIMTEGELNSGFICSNANLMRAVIVIGPYSDGKEFLDTLTHEIHHLAVAIASNLGHDLEGETPAYINGDAVRELAGIICEIGCSGCKPSS